MVVSLVRRPPESLKCRMVQTRSVPITCIGNDRRFHDGIAGPHTVHHRYELLPFCGLLRYFRRNNHLLMASTAVCACSLARNIFFRCPSHA